jgi:protein O-mannosyl-transferase
MARRKRRHATAPSNQDNVAAVRSAMLGYGIALGVIIAAVYARGASTPFLFDDLPSITENASIVHLWPLVGNATQFGPLNPPRSLSTSGRPLVNLSFAINYQVGGLNPVGYHIFNIVLHWLSALLLMAIVQRTLRLEFFRGHFDGAALPLGFLAALLWALHPLQTETVVYTTQRTELMVGFFYFAVLYAALRYWSSTSNISRKNWLALAVVACFAGMACKEVMFSAPVLVLLFERTFITGSFRKAFQQSWGLYTGLFAGWILLLWLNYDGPRSDSAGFHLGIPAFAWWFTQAKMLWIYLKLVVWPWPLVTHYLMPYINTIGQGVPWLLMTVALVLSTVLLLWWRYSAGFVGSWVLIILSPTMIVPIVTEVGAERRMYLPTAAIMALVIAFAYTIAERTRNRSARNARSYSSGDRRNVTRLAIAAALLAIVWACVDIQRISAYADPPSLWQEAVDTQLYDYLVCDYFGSGLLKTGRSEEALGLFKRSIQLNPSDAIAHDNLGLTLSALGHTSEAIMQQELAVKLQPNYPNAHNDLGVTLLKSGQREKALQQFRQALDLKPQYADPYYNMGLADANQGDLEHAQANFEEAVRLNPDYVEAYNNLGAVLAQLGKTDQALHCLQQAIERKPTDAQAHNNFGNVLFQSGHIAEAIAQYEQTLKLQPNNPRACANLAKAYAATNRFEAAIATAEKGIEIARSRGDEQLADAIRNWLEGYRNYLADPLKRSPESHSASGAK